MTRVQIIAGLATLLLAVPAAGWKSVCKWDARVVGYRVNPDNQDVSNAKALSALRSSAQAWTAQTKAGFRFRYDGATSATTQGLNAKNVVLFRNALKSPGDTARATAYKWMIGGKIIEFDIVFWDKAASFITGSTSCSGEIYLENTAIHEFGHALGLEHTSDKSTTMYGGSSACSRTRLSLHADDIAGANTLYPCSSSSQCNDANICTKDSCSNSRCQRTAIAGCCTSKSQCDDGKACTKDSCSNNVCKHAAIAGCCTSNSQCDDGKACTKDTCSNNVCKHAAIAGCCTSKSQCDDGKACTRDSCSNNVCKHAAVAGCCTSNSQCDDGKACTKDSCSNNICKHAAIAGCGDAAPEPDSGASSPEPDSGAISPDDASRPLDQGVDGHSAGPPGFGTDGAKGRGSPDEDLVTGGCALGGAPPPVAALALVGVLLGLHRRRR